FKKMIEFIKANKRNVDLLLFIKWDRFSRNATHSYAMLDKLNVQFNVESQAIEQPLDLSIPENKVMLGWYLILPEVENDRRSMNVTSGMRKARKEGRFLGVAPKGYSNKRDDNNKPIIVPNEKSVFIERAFEIMATGESSQVDALTELRKDGFKCSKNQFSILLRNLVYIGKLKIPAYKDEEEIIVDAIHEALVSESLFNQVQQNINGKTKKAPPVYKKQDDLPLRGNLICDCCGRKLTGSASKGNGGRYFYYHCTKGCKVRYKAQDLNTQFEELLGTFTANKEVTQVYYDIIKNELKDGSANKGAKVRKVNEAIELNENRITKLQDDFADGNISGSDYKSMKTRYEYKLNELSVEKAEIKVMNSEFQDYLSFGCSFIENLDAIYSQSDTNIKQKIVGSIFPENLTYSKNGFRTTRTNEAVLLLSNHNRHYEGKLKGQTRKKTSLSYSVNPIGFEP
ncbi:MAG: recombinase family protein, partial [Flavobacteriales bacterium]|nr:recombinase family protein [Flavobacteriales bacterium]